jgi:hypothetical protein
MVTNIMDDFQNASATRIVLGKLQPLRVLMVLAGLSFSASVEQYLRPASRPAACLRERFGRQAQSLRPACRMTPGGRAAGRRLG